MFPLAVVFHLNYNISDHCPILIDVVGSRHEQRRKRKHTFRFEEVWTQFDDCQQVISMGWSKPTMAPQTAFDVALKQKLRECKAELAVWGKTKRGNYLHRIMKARQSLQEAIEAGGDVEEARK